MKFIAVYLLAFAGLTSAFKPDVVPPLTDTVPPDLKFVGPLVSSDTYKDQPSNSIFANAEPITEIERRDDYDGHYTTIPLGDKRMHFVTSKARSWESLFSVVRSINTDPENTTVTDRNFNAAGGSGSEILANSKGAVFATLLNAEYEAIYDDMGWTHNRSRPVRTDRQRELAILRQASKYKMAAVIDEFGFIDDRINGDEIAEYMRSDVGQKEIARATIAAVIAAPGTDFVFLAGHHRDSGHSGASFEGFHETTYAFETFNAMAAVLASEDITAFEPVMQMSEVVIPAPSYIPATRTQKRRTTRG